MVGIYKITSPSGKVYIGQSINIKDRWEWYNKLRCKQQPKLYFSLKKYGPKNHKFEIIEQCSEELLLERETWWKLFYRVLDKPSLCCKIDGKGGRDSKETRKKKSKSQLGNKYNLGRIQSQETKDKISKKLKGRKRSKLTIKRMSKPRVKLDKFKTSNKGKKIKSVLQYDKQGNFIKEYPSVWEAEQNFNSTNHSNISACCLGKQKTAWGYIWKYK